MKYNSFKIDIPFSDIIQISRALNFVAGTLAFNLRSSRDDSFKFHELESNFTLFLFFFKFNYVIRPIHQLVPSRRTVPLSAQNDDRRRNQKTKERKTSIGHAQSGTKVAQNGHQFKSEKIVTNNTNYFTVHCWRWHCQKRHPAKRKASSAPKRQQLDPTDFPKWPK